MISKDQKAQNKMYAASTAAQQRLVEVADAVVVVRTRGKRNKSYK